MKRAARGITRITIFGEDLPQLENRVELASDKDEFGMPLARLIHSFNDDAMALWNANFEQGMKVAKATTPRKAGRARDPWCRPAICTAGPSWAPRRQTR